MFYSDYFVVVGKAVANTLMVKLSTYIFGYKMNKNVSYKYVYTHRVEERK